MWTFCRRKPAACRDSCTGGSHRKFTAICEPGFTDPAFSVYFSDQQNLWKKRLLERRASLKRVASSTTVVIFWDNQSSYPGKIYPRITNSYIILKAPKQTHNVNYHYALPCHASTVCCQNPPFTFIDCYPDFVELLFHSLSLAWQNLWFNKAKFAFFFYLMVEHILDMARNEKVVTFQWLVGLQRFSAKQTWVLDEITKDISPGDIRQHQHIISPIF